MGLFLVSLRGLGRKMDGDGQVKRWGFGMCELICEDAKPNCRLHVNYHELCFKGLCEEDTRCAIHFIQS